MISHMPWTVCQGHLGSTKVMTRSESVNVVEVSHICKWHWHKIYIMEAQIRISWLVTISGNNKIAKFLLLKITTWYIPPYRQNERCNMFQIKIKQISGTQMNLGPKLNSLGARLVFYSDHKIESSLFKIFWKRPKFNSIPFPQYFCSK